jgi:hypothetical protein
MSQRTRTTTFSAFETWRVQKGWEATASFIRFASIAIVVPGRNTNAMGHKRPSRSSFRWRR